jgi:hypothetical protein
VARRCRPGRSAGAKRGAPGLGRSRWRSLALGLSLELAPALERWLRQRLPKPRLWALEMGLQQLSLGLAPALRRWLRRWLRQRLPSPRLLSLALWLSLEL